MEKKMNGKTSKLLRKYASLRGTMDYWNMKKMYRELNTPGREAFTRLAREEVALTENERSD
jgi:hypothetical protein